MPNTTRTRRPSTAAGRFGRSSAGTAGRFGRSSAGGTAKRRPSVPQRHGMAGGWLQRRRPPKQSALKRAMGGSGAKVGGGLAVLAGAAGLLFKNRDKMTSRMGGGGAHQTPQ